MSENLQPTDGQDGKKGNLLAHGDLKLPQSTDWKGGDEQVGSHVQRSVGVVHTRNCVRNVLIQFITQRDLRILVDALCKRLLRKVPVRIYWHASEDGREDGSGSTCHAESHDNVDW